MNVKAKKRIIQLFITEMGLEELPDTANQLFIHMSYRELAMPLVKKWRKEGLTIGKLVIRSGLTERQVKQIIYGY